jgi:hypothetical protein
MGNMSKGFCYLLVVMLTASSLIVAESASAQTTPKPSVPEFTIRYVDINYDVPATTPTYKIDQFTGEQIQATSGEPGYHVEEKSLEFIIQNQPLASYINSNGRIVQMFYNFRFKGQFGDWIYFPFNPDGTSVYREPSFYEEAFGASALPNIYSGPSPSESVVSVWLDTLSSLAYQEIPDGVAIDVQAQAMFGYTKLNVNDYVVFCGQTSDWSPTQTVTLVNGASYSSINTSAPPTPSPIPSASPTPTETPTATSSLTPANPNLPVNQFAFLAIGIAVTIVAVCLGLIVYVRKRRG